MLRFSFFFFLLPLLLWSGSSSAQLPERPDIRQRLKTANTDTARSRLFTLLGRSHKPTDPDSALFFLEKGAEAGKVGDAPSLEARARLNIGQVYTARGEYKPAIQELDEAKALYNRAEDVIGVGKCWNSLGAVYYYQAEFRKAKEAYANALEHFSDPYYVATTYNNVALNAKMLGEGEEFVKNELSALHKFEEIGHQERSLYCLGNLAIFFIERGDLEKAMEYNQRGFALTGQEFNPEQENFLNLQKAEILDLQGKLDESLATYQRVRALASENELLEQEANAFAGIAHIYMQQEQFDLARPRLKKALLLFDQMESKRGIAFVRSSLGRIQVFESAPDSGIRNLNIALDLALELGEPTTLIAVYDHLALAHEFLGNTREALHFRNNYIELKNALHDPMELRKILEMESQYQVKLEEAKQQEQELQNAIQARKRTYLYIGLAILLVLLLVAGLIVFLVKRDRNQQAGPDPEVEGRLRELRELLELKETVIRELSQNPQEAEQKLPPHFDSLTNREIEIFLCLGAGLSDKEIAAELFVSLPTVRTHSRNVFSKLNVHKRSEVVKMAHEYNLLRK